MIFLMHCYFDLRCGDVTHILMFNLKVFTRSLYPRPASEDDIVISSESRSGRYFQFSFLSLDYGCSIPATKSCHLTYFFQLVLSNILNLFLRISFFISLDPFSKSFLLFL